MHSLNRSVAPSTHEQKVMQEQTNRDLSRSDMEKHKLSTRNQLQQLFWCPYTTHILPFSVYIIKKGRKEFSYQEITFEKPGRSTLCCREMRPKLLASLLSEQLKLWFAFFHKN